MKYYVVFILFAVGIFSNCNIDEFELKHRPVIIGKVVNVKTGNPISDVVISDGYSTTLTKENGTYQIQAHIDARYVFYSIPEEYKIKMGKDIPKFYSEIDIDTDTCVINFHLSPLQEGKENDFTLFCVADPQVRTIKHVKRFQRKTIKDIENEKTKHTFVYGITLGDLVDDTPDLFEETKDAFASTKIPFFHTIGNHDYLKEETNPLKAIDLYQNHFGPVNYSFSRGSVHFVVMNNVLSNDMYGFTDEQIQWLKSDLNHVPKGKLLIICVHVPILENDKILNKDRFLEILKPFNEIHIMAGHSHYNKNNINYEYDVYEHITGAASGMWWSLPINRDGAPKGYGVYEISDNKIQNWYYKSSGYDIDYQVKTYMPNSENNVSDYIIANVWNADPRWKIELYENGIYRGEMEQFSDYDPDAYQLIESTGRENLETDNSSKWYIKTNHLYRLKPQEKNSDIRVKATDRFGNVFFQ